MPARTEIACRLTAPDLAARLTDLRTGLLAQVSRSTTLADGIRLSLPASDQCVDDGLEFIRFERQCCPFLGFAITLPPDTGSFTLNISGPPEAQSYIRETFLPPVTGSTQHD